MEAENLNKQTSRKNEGAQENNRNEVRELVGSASRYADGIAVITDRGGNRIYVDTVNGISGLLVSVYNFSTGKYDTDVKWYADGSSSVKKNGYVYTPVVISGLNGKLQTIQYGTHNLVCMLAHTAEYDALVAQDKTPIPNHENNCSWNNREDNLGWCSVGENNTHGKIVASLHRSFPNSYTHIENNQSDVDFVVLDEKLTVEMIKEYCEEIDSKYEFKCANNEYINELVLNAFVDWLIDKGYWTGNTYEQ